MNATREMEHWQRHADYLEQEAKIALVRWDDAATFQIYSNGADLAREMAETWKARILGGK